MPRIEIADLPVDHTLDVDALERVRGGLSQPSSTAQLSLNFSSFFAIGGAGIKVPGDLVSVTGKKVK